MTADYDSGRNGEDARLDPEKLREMTEWVIEALTDPRYVEAVTAVRTAPEEERLVEASRRLSLEGLRERGVPIPPGMRLSSRYFEPGFPDQVELGDPPEGRINMVNALNDHAPGLLDRLRTSQPQLYSQLAKPEPGPAYPRGLCACGGTTEFHVTACGGVGTDLI